MIVRCIADELTTQQHASIGGRSTGGRWPITVDKDYLVFGLTVHFGSFTFGSGVYCEIEQDHDEFLIPMPLALFSMVDSRVSPTWRLQTYDDGGLTLWPETLYQPSFNDRLSDGELEALVAYRALKSVLEAE